MVKLRVHPAFFTCPYGMTAPSEGRIPQTSSSLKHHLSQVKIQNKHGVVLYFAFLMALGRSLQIRIYHCSRYSDYIASRRPTNLGSIPDRDKRFWSFPKRLHRGLAPPSPLFNRQRIKKAQLEAEHALLSHIASTIEWSYTSTLAYAFMSWCLITDRDNFALLDSNVPYISLQLTVQRGFKLSSGHDAVLSGSELPTFRNNKGTTGSRSVTSILKMVAVYSSETSVNAYHNPKTHNLNPSKRTQPTVTQNVTPGVSQAHGCWLASFCEFPDYRSGAVEVLVLGCDAASLGPHILGAPNP